MALRDELLGITGIGPTLADKVMAVVEAESEKRHAAMDEAIESVEDIFGPVVSVPTSLVTALRAAKTGCNPPNGCPLCGVDGCHERCPAWNV